MGGVAKRRFKKQNTFTADNMKKLDQFLLKSFVGPFIAILAIVRQVYIIQNAILGAAATVLSLLLSHIALLFVNNISRAYGIVLNPARVYPLGSYAPLPLKAIS